MVQGAALELVAGDAALLATDVGPVIDVEAFDSIQKHIERLKNTSKMLVDQQNMSKPAPNIVAPCAFEVASISDVKTEIFGPVLHIVRCGGAPALVIDQINALGYGLTLDIQTRIDSRAQQVAARAHVGNVYINRAMTGGPKAGGPHYLLRFCTE